MVLSQRLSSVILKKCRGGGTNRVAVCTGGFLDNAINVIQEVYEMEDVRAILNDFMNGVNDISKEEGMTVQAFMSLQNAAFEASAWMSRPRN